MDSDNYLTDETQWVMPPCQEFHDDIDYLDLDGDNLVVFMDNYIAVIPRGNSRGSDGY